MQRAPPFLRKRVLPPSASLLPQRSAASVAPHVRRGERRLSESCPGTLLREERHGFQSEIQNPKSTMLPALLARSNLPSDTGAAICLPRGGAVAQSVRAADS